jgi:hypothetical protein
MSHRVRLKAPRNVGFSCTVSARALKVAGVSLAAFLHQPAAHLSARCAWPSDIAVQPSRPLSRAYRGTAQPTTGRAHGRLGTRVRSFGTFRVGRVRGRPFKAALRAPTPVCRPAPVGHHSIALQVIPHTAGETRRSIRWRERIYEIFNLPVAA